MWSWNGLWATCSRAVRSTGDRFSCARELDARLLGCASVVVEDVATALREAGDVILAIPDGTLKPADLLHKRAVMTGAVELPTDRPLIFKGVGMPWHDLVVAAAVLHHNKG
jgi:ornithine cyclodeaminase